jgi:type II secretory pathway component PulM
MPRIRRHHQVVPKLAELQSKLDGVRREVRNLTVMGMDPNQAPEQAALIRKLERSARAEQRLRKMALDYAKSVKTWRRSAAPRSCR